MLTTSRITPHMCEGTKTLLITMRKKFTKRDVIKRVMKEQKQCFGALLETKKEKIRRFKQRKKGALQEANTNENDSEFSWMMKVSDTRLRLMKFNNDTASPMSEKTFTVESSPLQGNTKPNETERSEQRSVDNKVVDTLILQKSPVANHAGYLRLPRVEIKRFCQDRRTGKARVSDSSNKITNSNIGDIVKLPKKNNFPTVTSSSSKIKESKEHTKISSPTSLESTICHIIEPIEETCKISPQPEDAKINYNRRESIEGIVTPSPAILSPEEIINNVNEAQLYDEEAENLDDFSQTSEIHSISRTQDTASLQLPSVTKILKCTMSDKDRGLLELWIAKMTKELGADGFLRYKKEFLENGALFHSSIDRALRKLSYETPEPIERSFNSLQSVLKDLDHVRAIESHVVHHKLGYRGVLDCVASFRGKMCLIEWKQSHKTKNIISATYDAPLQIASYVGAFNADKNYPFKVKSGAIVVAYMSGNEPTIYELDETKLKHYWRQWLIRLRKYYELQIP